MNGTSESFKSTCSYCGVGCGMVVTKEKTGVLKVEGDKDNPVNKGMLCSKGMNIHYTVMDKSDRLLYPQMRYNRSMPLQRVTWDAALDRASAIFKNLIQKYGPNSVGFYVSGQCLTEEYYVVNKLTKGFLGTNNIDTNSRLCMSSAVVGYKLSLGEDSVPCSYEDIELADCFYIAGANPAWCHPILWRRIEAYKAANPDVKIIVADPRKTQTCSLADIHLQINPGTDIVLNNAIASVLIDRDMVDKEYISKFTNGYEELKKEVAKKSVKEAAKICGVSAEDIYWAAEYIGRSKGFITMWAMGYNQSVVGVNKNLSLINLNLITGKIGKPGSGPFSLTGQPNAMGGREVGGLANLLPAHRDLLNADHRAEVERFWKVEDGTIQSKPGLTAVEMFDALASGEMKAIWIICTNPMVSLPDSAMVEKGLKNAKFVVVQDISERSETVEYADLVLPAAMWAEKEGTMTNSERRISYLNKLTEPPSEALPDIEILCRFAKKMGFEGFDFKNASEIYDEHIALTEGTNIDISGLSYDILKEKGSVQWPYPKGHSGSGVPRLFVDGKFYTADQKAKIHSVVDVNLSEPIDQEFPLVLTTGRIRDQWHTMTRTGKVNKLNQHIAENYLEIHPKDAEKRGIKEGDLVQISGRRGFVRIKAKVTADIKRGVVFMPMHWGKTKGSKFSRTNNLTNRLFDAKSKEPDLKFSAVEVVKYMKQPEKIVIVGAGAGAYGFVKSFRELNSQDEIHIFSKEKYPFYNRVMLPDYISGEQLWDQLVKMKDDEENDLKIKLHRGVSVTHIDRGNKVLTTDRGEEVNYDKLIIATGSRPTRPKDLPNIDGIFTMRTRDDADSFKDYVPEGGHVVIVGGGLLGLELSASLRELNIRVTVIQRISRLMDRQLDNLGSDLLHQEVADRGVEVLYNDEVQLMLGKERIMGIKLKSGRTLQCDAIVYSIGTTPNIELARECGLQCNRGVVVNEYLQTSDENVFAVGEIAEWERMMWGITAAAEQQAEIVAKYINGDETATYKGSLSMNILKMSGIQLCSIGVVDTQGDPDYEEVVFIDRAKRYYKKCVIHKDKLVGTILIGDKSEFAEFKEMIQGSIELSEKRLQLLRSGKKAESVIGRLVCSCNNVGEGNIVNKIKSGCEDFKSLCQETGAGTGCGSCRPEVKAILEKVLVAV